MKPGDTVKLKDVPEVREDMRGKSGVLVKKDNAFGPDWWIVNFPIPGFDKSHCKEIHLVLLEDRLVSRTSCFKRREMHYEEDPIEEFSRYWKPTT